MATRYWDADAATKSIHNTGGVINPLVLRILQQFNPNIPDTAPQATGVTEFPDATKAPTTEPAGGTTKAPTQTLSQLKAALSAAQATLTTAEAALAVVNADKKATPEAKKAAQVRDQTSFILAASMGHAGD